MMMPWGREADRIGSNALIFHAAYERLWEYSRRNFGLDRLAAPRSGRFCIDGIAPMAAEQPRGQVESDNRDCVKGHTARYIYN
ncbi:hypothetical protein, partial [Sphingobium sp.]|uniref:hypothetical protein n=1 Tax=Sphingobium sp. TaxID=1912891 RepID=UPI00257B5303